MEGWTDGANGLGLAVGPSAIGKQHDGQLLLKVDPQGSSGITEMAGRAPAEKLAGRRRLGRCIPPQCPGTIRRQLGAAAEELDGFRCEKSLFAEKASSVKKRIERIGEEAGMATDSTQHGAVFILDLALDNAVAEGEVLFGRRDEIGRAHV